MNTISPARAAAFSILQKVGAGRGHSDDLLHTVGVNALSAEDRNLTTTLVLGVLRWQIALDTVIRALVQRPFQETPVQALIALRIGALQLLLLDRIPAHAALNESVELARANGAEHAVGMVNAVLRRITRERDTLLPKITAEAAHPQWLFDRWQQYYGAEAAHQIAEADQQPPHAASLFLNGDAPQIDDGSRLIAEIAAAAHSAPQRILDCCAAPGGKTIVLARRHPNATIIASDVNEKRLTAMQRRMERDGITNVKTTLADLTMPQRSGPFTKGFDLILCDVPCSGTGTLGRNPEIRHHLRPSDLAPQAQRQRAILSTALSLLAAGGRLLYSTCSLEPEENEDVLQPTLQRAEHAHLRQLDPMRAITTLAQSGSLSIENAAHLKATAMRGATLRTLPGVHAMDGFFAALLERPA